MCARSRTAAVIGKMEIVPIARAQSSGTPETKFDVERNDGADVAANDGNGARFSIKESDSNPLLKALVGTDSEAALGSGATLAAFEKRRRELHRSLESFRSHAQHAIETGQEQGRFFVGSRLGDGSSEEARAQQNGAAEGEGSEGVTAAAVPAATMPAASVKVAQEEETKT